MSRLPDPQEEIRRGLKRWEGMSPEERMARLKEAGILDAQGHLAERYREPPRSEEADTDRSVG